MNKKGQLHVIKVFFIALAFILLFGMLAGTVTNSTETFTSAWAVDYPMLAWLMSTVNIWIFLGGLLGIIAMIVWGTDVIE